MENKDNKSSPSDSKILLSLIGGFISILVAMMFTWYISLQQMAYVSSVIDTSQINSAKMDLVAQLMEIARSRTRLTMEMIHTDDIFERDEINLELDRKATEFTLTRQNFFELGLSEHELQYFTDLDQAIKPALQQQRIAAQLALSDNISDRQQATEILLKDVYPAQGIIVDTFSGMLHEYKQQIATSSQLAQKQIEGDKNLNYLIFGVIFTLSFIIIVFVIRQIILTARSLNTEKEKAQSTIRSLGDAVITTDRKSKIEYVNQTAETLIGKVSTKLVGQTLADGFPAFDKKRECWVWEAAQKLISGEDLNPLSKNITLYSFENIEYQITVAISPIVDIHGATNGVIVSFHDVTQSQELLKKIQYQATHDALTGLLNRREFEARVSKSLTLYENNPTHAMCLIDLDSFKAVNDACGHAAGDQLLKQLSEYLLTKIRRSDFFGRLGGDEFAIFLSNTDSEHALKIISGVLESIKEFQFIWDNKHFRIGASIGMIDIPANFTDYNYLYKAVDTACYMAKNSGRNQIKRVNIDDSTLTSRVVESDWIAKINYALENDAFVLCSQSIQPLSLRTQGRKHVEVLIRMLDENQEDIISPMAFIPVAERYGMMDKIDLWVFSQVVQLIVRSPLDDTVYAVNLSGQTLSSKANMLELKKITEKFQLPPGRLCLEITETVAIANIEQARRFMENMQSIGCYIALDDFGSGLSSFSYLKNLPLDYIKIDGSFVQSIHADKSSLVMIDAIHNVGKKLGLITIAEFIENEETLDELNKIGIDMGQGYFFDQPHPLSFDNFPGNFSQSKSA